MAHLTRDLVLATYERLLLAWNRRDADAFAALFADDGSTVGFDGSQLDGRSAIATSLRAIFEGHATAAYVAIVREVRTLAPGVALVRAVAGMAPAGATAPNPAVNAIQSVVLVERGDRAEVALLHNTPAALHGRPDDSAALTRELTDALRSGRVVT